MTREISLVVFCHSFILYCSVIRILAQTRLEPEKLLLNQVLHHRETVLYHLVQLKPSKSYELRVSYPSTTPTDFYIQLIPHKALQASKTRKLLNIEKLVFSNELKEQYANVTAVRTGIPYNPASLAEPVVYNIVLEELLLGIPWHTWRLGVLVLLVVYITFKYLVPRFLMYIEENVRIHGKR